MEFRRLGSSGLKVSAVGLGCMSMTQSGSDRGESIATLERSLELGVTFWDTADIYSHGLNEQLVAEVLRTNRDRVVLATKCGIVSGSDDHPAGVNNRPEYIVRCCDASLKRLGTDVIDLYYLHRIDPTVPIEESVGAMASLVEAGKVRYIGVSEASATTIRRGHAVHPISAVQSEYSLWFREPEQSVIPACRELGIGFVPFSPLGRGILTGAIGPDTQFAPDDLRSKLPRFQGENLRLNVKLAEKLSKMAEARSCTASQLALAWLLAKGDGIVPIPGTKRRTYLEENAGAAAIHLAAEEVAAIEAELPAEAASGERYPEHMMKLIDK